MSARKTNAPLEVVDLPAPRTSGEVPLEEVIHRRRSVRRLLPSPLTEFQVSQLLWAAQGQLDLTGSRVTPSAGQLYPLELYVVTAAGFSRYLPGGHRAELWRREDLRADLAGAALGEESVRDAAAIFVITAVEERSAVKFGLRAHRYVILEAGHAAQNLLLQAEAIGLGAVPVGAYDDDAIHGLLGLGRTEKVLYLIPVGQRAEA